MTSGGGIFPSMCASMLLSQAIQTCYIFLHSFPPVLSFTLSKEQESVANTQNKVVHVPDWTVISKKWSGAFSSREPLTSYRKRRKPTWRKMWHPHLFSFCCFFSTPIFWMVSKRHFSLIQILGCLLRGWRVYHGPLPTQLWEMKMPMSFAAIRLFAIYLALKLMQKLMQIN